MTKARDISKLSAVEVDADATDTTNVTSSGALMDSELTNLAAVKAINQSLVTTADAAFASLTIPSDIIHAGDADTLLQFNAADSWRVITGDEERLKVSNGEVIINDNSVDMDFRVESNGNTHALFVNGGTGNVAIGSTNNGVGGAIDLSVGNTSSTGGITLWANTSGTHSLGFGDGYSGADRYRGYVEYAHNGDSMRFATSATERMRIDSSGNVNIGTTTEGASGAHNLTIADTGNAGITIRAGATSSSAIYMSDATSGAGEYAGYISYSHSSNAMTFATASSGRLTISSDGDITQTGGDLLYSGGINWDIKHTVGGQNILFSTTPSGGSATERMRIDSSGNVGIGTASPSAKLDVVTNDNVWTGEFTQQNTSNGDGVLVQVGSTAAADYALSVRSNAGNTSVIAAKADGKVGIGTFTPDNPLEVVGADSGIKISAGSSNRPMLRFECGSDEKLTLSANTAYGAIGDGSDANRYIILKDGNVGIGTTAPDALLHLKGGNEVAKIKFEVGTADADKFKIYASTAGRLYVNSYSGNTGVYLTYNGTSWTSNSDETLKDNITSLGTVGDKLKNYRTSYFNWKADTDTPPKRNIGFIAQDWETDFPEVVTKKEGETLGMQYTETIPILLKYIQELEARITALEA